MDARYRLPWRAVSAGASAALVIGALAACTPQPPDNPPARTVTSTPSAPAPSASRTASSFLQPVGTPTVVAEGLDAPWSMVRLPSGSTLISERDSGKILELVAGSDRLRTVGTVPGVVHAGEGGLLGLAVQDVSAPPYLYAYLTTRSDNRVVRMPLHGVPGGYAIGGAQKILTGIPKATIHNGGRIAFGPDGMLYITAGDAQGGNTAQDPASLDGTILRVKPDGTIPDDNPFPGSPVYSYGHRNSQGLAWDGDGRLWASEFGQNTWDELNVIRPGKNYGWPTGEGIAHDARFVGPIHQWHTDVASPSGLTIIGDTLFMAGLGGQRLWVMYPNADATSVDAVAWFTDTYGRIRDVVPGPVSGNTDTLWMLTNNTDGRGTPKKGDDKIIQVRLGPLREG